MNVKNGPVVVMGNEEGKVVTVSENNPEQGSIWLTQTTYTIDPITSFVNKKTRHAWIRTSVVDLLEMGYQVGEELPGNIVRLESLKPFSTNPEYADRDIKIAGDTGVVCKLGGQPIYSIARYVPDESVKDDLLDHDNTAEIKAAQAGKAEEKAVQPDEDFSIGG